MRPLVCFCKRDLCSQRYLVTAKYVQDRVDLRAIPEGSRSLWQSRAEPRVVHERKRRQGMDLVVLSRVVKERGLRLLMSASFAQ